MVDLLGIAPGNQVQRTLGQVGFDAHDGGGIGRGLVGLLAGQLEDALDVRHILLPQLDGFRVRLQVVIAVGQPKPALVRLSDHRVRVLEILPRAELEKRRDAVAVQVRDFFGKLRLVLQIADAVKLRLERSDPLGVDGLFIHAGGVIIPDFLRDCVAIGRRPGRIFQNLVEDFAVALGQFLERAPSRLIGGDGVALHPAATGVLVEVHAGADGWVEILYDAGARGRRLGSQRDAER